MLTRKEALKIATESCGKTCQSSVLTMISNCGQKKIPQPAQKVYGYEIVNLLGGVELMLVVGDTSVLWDTCYNFSK
jgi:hypothetical protein